MNTPDSLSIFGDFVIRHFRDKGIEQFKMLQEGKLRSPRMQKLYERIGDLDDDERQLLSVIVIDALDTALHDILFAIQDSHDRSLGIEVTVNGENVAELSGMLHGELHGDVGWIMRFSRFANEWPLGPAP